MENKIEINQNGYGYYIVLNNNFADDDDIINYLGITNEFYFQKGIEFGGKVDADIDLYFRFREDINEFKEWLEKHIDGFLIAKKLVGDL